MFEHWFLTLTEEGSLSYFSVQLADIRGYVEDVADDTERYALVVRAMEAIRDHVASECGEAVTEVEPVHVDYVEDHAIARMIVA